MATRRKRNETKRKRRGRPAKTKKKTTKKRQRGGASLAFLERMAGKAGKKVAEMGRFFASEWLREPGTKNMLVRKLDPFLKGGIDRVSTAIRPKLPYKTNRPRMDGSGIGVFDLVYGPNYAPWTAKAFYKRRGGR